MQKLSVIIPLFNQADSIGNMLDILFNQSLPLDIIVVNDMSTDNGTLVVKEKAKQNSFHRLRLINNEKKLYALHSRLHGLQYAQCEYTMFADGDDEIVGTDNLEKAFKEVSSKQFDIGHFRTQGRNRQKQELFADYPNTSPFGKELYDLEIFEHYFDKDYIPANLWGKMFKTAFIKQIAEKIKNIPIKRFDDKCMVSVAMLYAKSYLGSKTEIYEYTPNNFWPKEKFAARVKDLYTICNAMLPFMQEQNCPEELQNKFLRYIRKRITVNTGQLSILLKNEIQKDPSAVYQILHDLEPYIDKESLLQALLLSNTENAHTIVSNFEAIKELPHA